LLITNQEIAACVEVLIEARRRGNRIEKLPATPSSVAEAHLIQDRVAAALGEAVRGFKINAMPGDEPTRGLIYARMTRPSPARIAPAEAPHLGVETEIAFRFTRDPLTRPPLEQLADNLINGALVPGAETRDWSRLDLARLHVTLEVNGETVVRQQGGHAGNDPAGFAVALVNAMRGESGPDRDNGKPDRASVPEARRSLFDPLQGARRSGGRFRELNRPAHGARRRRPRRNGSGL
jgi:2-keto-4-pentenoate hydratase